jgi:hypothetical protein
MALMERYVAYGITLELPAPLWVRTPDRLPTDASVAVRLADRDASLSLWSGGETVWRTALPDGSSLEIQHGREGDHLMVHDGGALFHLSPDYTVATCHAAAGTDTPGWQRVMSDWLPYLLAVLRGAEALHASAVEHSAGGAVGFIGISGGGKSTSAAEMMLRGHRLLSDDVCILSRRAGRLEFPPGPPTVTLSRGPGGEPATRYGTRIANFGEETWVRAESCVEAPLTSYRALVLLERGDHEGATVVDEPAGVMALRRHALGMPHLVGREEERFARYAELARTARVLRLRAAGDVAPAELMAVVEDALAEHVAH